MMSFFFLTDTWKTLLTYTWKKRICRLSICIIIGIPSVKSNNKVIHLYQERRGRKSCEGRIYHHGKSTIYTFLTLRWFLLLPTNIYVPHGSIYSWGTWNTSLHPVRGRYIFQMSMLLICICVVFLNLFWDVMCFS